MKKRALIVEDEPRHRLLVDAWLSASGYEVAAVDDGSQVLSAVLRFKPDVILLDIILPTMDGFQVLRQLQEHEAACHIPVILLSALAQDDEIEQGLALGAASYITKPFDPAELMKTVDTLLAAA